MIYVWPYSISEILNQKDKNIKLKATVLDQSVDFFHVTIYKGAHLETSGY